MNIALAVLLLVNVAISFIILITMPLQIGKPRAPLDAGSIALLGAFRLAWIAVFLLAALVLLGVM